MKTPPAAPAQRLALSASLSSLLAASAANGVIITNSDLDPALSGFTVGDGGASSASWNIDGNGGAELEIYQSTTFTSSSFPTTTINGGTTTTWTSSTYSQSLNLTNFASGVGVVGSSSFLKNLAPGVVVNGGDHSFVESGIYSILFSGAISGATGFTSGTAGYIGFKFDSADLEPITLYGWAEVVLTEGFPYGSFEVIQWAYEDSGAGIMVGATTSAVPEPEAVAGGLGLLALGAAGLRRWRKQKQAA